MGMWLQKVDKRYSQKCAAAIILGALANLRKVTISLSFLSLRLSTWNNSAATGRIFIKFHICMYCMYVKKVKQSH